MRLHLVDGHAMGEQFPASLRASPAIIEYDK